MGIEADQSVKLAKASRVHSRGDRLTACGAAPDSLAKFVALRRASSRLSRFGGDLSREQIEAARSQLGAGEMIEPPRPYGGRLAALRICHHHQLNETFRTSGWSLESVGSFPARGTRCRSSSGPPQLTAQGGSLSEIDVRERLPGGVLHDEARRCAPRLSKVAGSGERRAWGDGPVLLPRFGVCTWLVCGARH